MSDVCKACDGTGMAYDECPTCGRNGWVDDPRDGGTIVCPDCDGDSSETCDACDGTGEAYE